MEAKGVITTEGGRGERKGEMWREVWTDIRSQGRKIYMYMFRNQPAVVTWGKGCQMNGIAKT